MKIIATSDWHLGNMFHGNDRLPEHKHFLNWLLKEIEERKPDALLVAGDVFDNGNPSSESQKAYYDFMARAMMKCPDLKIVVTAGNHDSASRLEAVQPILECLNVTVKGNVDREWDRTLNEGKGGWSVNYGDMIVPIGEEVVVIAVPFLRSDAVKGVNYSEGVMNFLKEVTAEARRQYPGRFVLMMAHMYAKGADIAHTDASEKIVIGGQEEVTMGNWEDHPDYLTCGHIHKRQHIWNTKWARYTGSILPMSFAEKDYRHGVDLLNIDGGNVNVEFIEYVPQHGLLVLPKNGEGASAKELEKLIKAELIDKKYAHMSSDCMYVLLKLKQDKVSNDEIKKLEALMQTKDAILCKIQRILPQLAIETKSGEQIISVEDILNRNPLDTIKEAFTLKDRTLNPEQEELLQNVINTVKTS